MDSKLEQALWLGARKHRAALGRHLVAFVLWLVALAGWAALNLQLVSWLLRIAPSSPPERFVDYLSYALDAIAVLLIMFAIGALRYVGIRIYVGLTARWRCIRNLRRRSPIQACAELWLVLEARRPFALYLRSFAAERQEHDTDYIEYPNPTSQPPHVGRGYLRLEIHERREDDSAIVAALAARLPVFALANAADPTPPAGMMVLFAATDWFDVFTALAHRATLNVGFESQRTSGLLREAAYLEEHGLAERTVWLRPGDDVERILEHRWSRLRLADPRAPRAG